MKWRMSVIGLLLLLCTVSGGGVNALTPLGTVLEHSPVHPMEQVVAGLQVGEGPLAIEKESFAPVVVEIVTTENRLVQGFTMNPGRHQEALELAPGRYILRVRPLLTRGPDREIRLRLLGDMFLPADRLPTVPAQWSQVGQMLYGPASITLLADASASVVVTVDGERLAGSPSWQLDPGAWSPGLHLVKIGAHAGELGLEVWLPWATDRTPLYADLAHEAMVWFDGSARLMADRGWMRGYPDGTFRPEVQVSRAELAEVLIRVFGQGDVDPSAVSERFVDVAPGAWYERSALVANGRGWIKGRPEGNGFAYDGDRPVTRDELLVVLCRALGWEELAEQVTDHGDRKAYEPAAAWARPCIALSAKVGLIGAIQPSLSVGWEPDQPVTRAELSYLLSLLAYR